MQKGSLTPQEYELHLKDLRDRLRTYLDTGVGDAKELTRDAEAVLELADNFPEVFQRYEDVQGLVGELLARQEQAKFLSQSPPRQAPGCLLGWLLRPRSR